MQTTTETTKSQPSRPKRIRTVREVLLALPAAFREDGNDFNTAHWGAVEDIAAIEGRDLDAGELIRHIEATQGREAALVAFLAAARITVGDYAEAHPTSWCARILAAAQSVIDGNPLDEDEIKAIEDGIDLDPDPSCADVAAMGLLGAFVSDSCPMAVEMRGIVRVPAEDGRPDAADTAARVVALLEERAGEA